MTNYIKRLMACVLLAGSVFVTPVLAEDAPAPACAITRLQAQEEMAKVEGMTARDLTKEETTTLIEKKGPPPNANGTEGLIFELVIKDEIAAVNVYQNGCFLTRLGPSLKQTVFNILGIVES